MVGQKMTPQAISTLTLHDFVADPRGGMVGSMSE